MEAITLNSSSVPLGCKAVCMWRIKYSFSLSFYFHFLPLTTIEDNYQLQMVKHNQRTMNYIDVRRKSCIQAVELYFPHYFCISENLFWGRPKCSVYIPSHEIPKTMSFERRTFGGI